MKHQSPQYRIAIYLVILLLATITANLLAAQLADSSVAALVLMTSPALAALLASLATQRSFKEIGWRLTPIRWLGVGWALPILYAVPAYALLWLTGLGSVPNPTFLERARFTLNMPDTPNGLLIVAAFFYITIINLIPSMLLSLGEEIGWRGFLVPELSKWLGLRHAAWLSGVIWAVWHLPGILTSAYGAQNTPLVYRIVCFTLMVVASGMIMAWLRMKSGSVWAVAIMHATHNGIIQTFLDRITINTGKTAYFIGEFGAVLLPILLLLAWAAWRQMGQTDEKTATMIYVPSRT